MNSQLERLSKQAAALESRLAAVSAEYAELYHALGPFIARMQTEIMPLHYKLLEVKREVADLKLMQGSPSRTELSDDLQTPLSALVDEGDLSVQEQYERYGMGKRPPKASDPDPLPEPSPQLVQLYEKAVAEFHPALATSKKERQKLYSLKKRADHAYAKRDTSVLRKLLGRRLEPVSNVPAIVDERDVQRMQDRIFALEEAINTTEGQLFELRHGDMAKVRGYHEAAEQQGRDFLKQLETELKLALRAAVAERDQLRAG